MKSLALALVLACTLTLASAQGAIGAPSSAGQAVAPAAAASADKAVQKRHLRLDEYHKRTGSKHVAKAASSASN